MKATRRILSYHDIYIRQRPAFLKFFARKNADQSWDKLLQGIYPPPEGPDAEKPPKHSPQSPVTRLQNELKFALASRRSSLKGDLLPYVVAKEVVDLYKNLSDEGGKAAFFKLISEELGVHFAEAGRKASLFANMEEKEYGQLVQAKERLHESLTPPYKYLLLEIGRLDGGVKFLVDMRKDLLELNRSKALSLAYPSVRVFDKYLREHLAQWFAAGFLELEHVTWDCSASFLEKVMNCEKVHKMQHLEDLKQRLGKLRRCFIFSHRFLPGEPLIVLHTALWRGVPTCVQDILTERTTEGFDRPSDTAAFYSISSTQAGLSGIDLGNFLIKTVVQKLQQELPNIKQFATLSPIPGFRKWLDYHLSRLNNEESIQKLLRKIDFTETPFRDYDYIDCLRRLKVELDTSDEFFLPDRLKKPMLQLCARYVALEKRRNFAFDSVANFHLRNGAILWQLNWLGDKSRSGFSSSYGIMVNYKYDLDQVEKNNRAYLLEGTIAISESVKGYLVY